MSGQRVLVVDDEATIRRALTRMLRGEGYEILTAADGEEALEIVADSNPDLILLDVVMPKLNGFEVCQKVKSDPERRLTPVVIVSSSSSQENRVRGIDVGCDDFLSKPFDRCELTARVRSLLRIKRHTDELERAEAVLLTLARIIEGKDPCTEGHCERLALNATRLARRLGRPDEDIVSLRRAGIVHDIGKVAVPDAILMKPARLTDDEMAVMKLHPVTGEHICRGLKSFASVLPIIRHHHEKLDGTGYPDGLRGDEIPVTALILQVVDVFDALTSERPYKPAMANEKALGILEEEVGKGWWDPSIFREFSSMVEDLGFETPQGEVADVFCLGSVSI